MAEYPIHPYIIHCLEPLLANAAAPVVLALDGRCGSGKTTMAAALAEQFPDSIVLHTDDFYLPPADRVPGWEQTPCANMDLARLRDDVLAPARAGKPVLYRAYSCREGARHRRDLHQDRGRAARVLHGPRRQGRRHGDRAEREEDHCEAPLPGHQDRLY